MTKKPTKKWRREEARRLIDKNVIGVEFSDEDTTDLNAVLGTAFDRFIRRKNPKFPSDPRHLYALAGNVWDSFSWVKAIYPLPDDQVVKKVMRSSIQQEMNDYLDAQDDPTCVKCGTTDDLTADHTPPFDSIVMEFVAVHGWPEIQPSPDGVGNMIKDINVEAAWIAFHQSRILYLQVLCRPCNASKGKRPQTQTTETMCL